MQIIRILRILWAFWLWRSGRINWPAHLHLAGLYRSTLFNVVPSRFRPSTPGSFERNGITINTRVKESV